MTLTLHGVKVIREKRRIVTDGDTTNNRERVHLSLEHTEWRHWGWYTVGVLSVDYSYTLIPLLTYGFSYFTWETSMHVHLSAYDLLIVSTHQKTESGFFTNRVKTKEHGSRLFLIELLSELFFVHSLLPSFLPSR